MSRLETRMLRHYRIALALHRLRDGHGRALLLLHGLGEQTPEHPPAYLDAWPGPVWGLDLTGHGESSVPTAGGYTAEILLADVDQAVAELGEVTVLGRGLGAYLALLIAGARPESVRGAILFDGPGLVGGGVRPGSAWIATLDVGAGEPAPDPFALAELARDVRSPDYANIYARLAVDGSDLDEPICVSTVSRPEWLTSLVEEPGVADLPLLEAITRYAAV
jgi:pimeloyl-ACP methyl ester carboxylesterase